MTIQEILMGLVKKKGLRRTARELGVDCGALYRSIHSDLRISTAQSILNLFGYDLKVVKRGEVKQKSKKKEIDGRETTLKQFKKALEEIRNSVH